MGQGGPVADGAGAPLHAAQAVEAPQAHISGPHQAAPAEDDKLTSAPA